MSSACPSQPCPTLPAPSCPTDAAYNECHQISTYDDVMTPPRRYQVKHVDQSAPKLPDPCDNKRFPAVVPQLKVCGNASVGCALEVRNSITAPQIAAPVGRDLDLSQSPVVLGQVQGHVVFGGSVTFAQSPYYLSNVGPGTGLVNPTSEGGPDFELFSLVSNRNSVAFAVNPNNTVSVDAAYNYPSMFQGSSASPSYASGTPLVYTATQTQYQPAFSAASVVVPQTASYLVNVQTWLVAPFSGASYFNVVVNGQTAATRLLPAAFPVGQTFYDAFTTVLTLNAGVVPVDLVVAGANQSVFSQITFVRLT